METPTKEGKGSKKKGTFRNDPNSTKFSPLLPVSLPHLHSFTLLAPPPRPTKPHPPPIPDPQHRDTAIIPPLGPIRVPDDHGEDPEHCGDPGGEEEGGDEGRREEEDEKEDEGRVGGGGAGGGGCFGW
ncbi:hypothetical protein I7I50_03199 [Histoplasma capsulatum G186AR]|uniref:Uncharacterized protein n=1 Tax=Ajellomyces capsulatus TaxID=5037 RepID=A0A8H7Z1E9_AJECA|nr:hypothetical protein I7I52_00132 [Histoplasma capsulatum]QSS72131.1 hypothetical protein I7I50_03199 [Histoplasma capsulatum G186AR]